jgi:hypothetical protein
VFKPVFQFTQACHGFASGGIKGTERFREIIVVVTMASNETALPRLFRCIPGIVYLCAGNRTPALSPPVIRGAEKAAPANNLVFL